MRPTWPSGVSTPSYRSWATDIVRLGLNPSLRLASCWSVLVVNGGAGLRLLWRVVSGVDDRRQGADRGGVALRGLAVADLGRLAVDPREVRGERRAVAVVTQGRLERPVLAGGEGADLALPLHDHAHGDGLHAAGGQAAADLARQQRAERVADEAVDDPAGLLGVDEVLVDVARLRRTRRGSRPR